MKKYILISVALFLASFVYSQTNKSEVDLIQAAIGMAKKDAVKEYVQVPDAQKDAFWQLYDEYETQRKELGKQRIDLLVQYSKEYRSMTNEQADAWIKNVIELQGKTDKLIVTYFKKIKKATDPIVATQFYQIENYILSIVRMKVLNEIPLVEK
jgi:hypothetical protein